ncbi:hypothetical protein EON81_15290 [bacterium]|nr:MAG: hypothetical protein EON81_15290 [bacterium]
MWPFSIQWTQINAVETMRNMGIVMGATLGAYNWWKGWKRIKPRINLDIIPVEGERKTRVYITNEGNHPVSIIWVALYQNQKYLGTLFDARSLGIHPDMIVPGGMAIFEEKLAHKHLPYNRIHLKYNGGRQLIYKVSWLHFVRLGTSEILFVIIEDAFQGARLTYGDETLTADFSSPADFNAIFKFDLIRGRKDPVIGTCRDGNESLVEILRSLEKRLPQVFRLTHSNGNWTLAWEKGAIRLYGLGMIGKALFGKMILDEATTVYESKHRHQRM